MDKKLDRSFKLRSFCVHIMRIILFIHLKWLLSNATNNINQIAKATNTTGVIYKNEIESMNKQIEKLSKRYEIYIPYFLINQKKVMVFGMAITKIYPVK